MPEIALPERLGVEIVRSFSVVKLNFFVIHISLLNSKPPPYISRHCLRKSNSPIVMNRHIEVARRAFYHSKGRPAGFATTAWLTRLALSTPSIRRKYHENVMSIVIGGSMRRDEAPAA